MNALAYIKDNTTPMLGQPPWQAVSYQQAFSHQAGLYGISGNMRSSSMAGNRQQNTIATLRVVSTCRNAVHLPNRRSSVQIASGIVGQSDDHTPQGETDSKVMG